MDDRVHVRRGFILFPAKRIQFMSEYSGLLFAGTATPNSTFGARHPVDRIRGVRVYIVPQAAVDIGLARCFPDRHFRPRSCNARIV